MTETQGELFNVRRELGQTVSIEPRDPNVEPEDKPRLTGQNAKILERLRQGPATNVELAQLALKYSSRVSDLRKAGFSVSCERVGRNGLTRYSLVGEP